MQFIKQNKIDLIYSDLDTIFEETSEGLRRIENIIRSLLGFCRKEDENEFVEYDINKGIKDTLIVAKNEIKYLAQVTEVLKPVPLIMGIHGEINQVLLNIIVNAAHAIREKEIMGTIEIHTYSEEDFVCCEISDNGAGIKEENIKRIFEPFFTTKPEGIGTGLGLSIAYDIIVNKHKGHLEVDSEVGKGTTFRLKLPEKHGA
jgi:signal transduction histidine kinase